MQQNDREGAPGTGGASPGPTPKGTRMNRQRLVIAVAIFSCLCAAPAFADSTFTTPADSTIDGVAGTILNIQPLGEAPESLFLYPQAGKIRVHATRNAGSTAWDLMTAAIYLVPKNNISVGETWRFLDDDIGGETVAEAIVEEPVATNAGTFTAWRVDVSLVSNPAQPIQSLWFADDIGIVREVDYFDVWTEWESNLETYTVSGNGYFPLSVGNTWTFLNGGVATEGSSVGAVKSRYRD